MKCTLCYRDCAVALHKPLYTPIFVDGQRVQPQTSRKFHSTIWTQTPSRWDAMLIQDFHRNRGAGNRRVAPVSEGPNSTREKWAEYCSTENARCSSFF